MLTKLSNIVTGRYRHWQTANNTYINALWAASQGFPPAIEPLFKAFTGASYFLVDELMGPDKGSKRLFKIDPLKITSDQFGAIHNLNIWSLVAVHCNLNPNQKGPIYAACLDFIGCRENERRLAYNIDLMLDLDIGYVCKKLHHELNNVLGIQNQEILDLDWFSMTPTFTYAFTNAMDIYKKDIANLR